MWKTLARTPEEEGGYLKLTNPTTSYIEVPEPSQEMSSRIYACVRGIYSACFYDF